MRLPSQPATVVRRALAVAIGPVLLAACTVGPAYTRPEVAAPAAWKELPPAKTAQPGDTLPRGAWWSVFGDATLDALERDADAANQNLRVAEANYRQAQAAVAAARAGLYPTLDANAAATRARSGGASRTGGGSSRSATQLQLGASADWELDLWGRVRNAVEASGELAQASAADVANVRLSIEAQVAQDYLQLRVTDATERLFADTVSAFERSLALTQNRYNAGVAARADVVQAETQLLGARASLIDVRAVRTQLEHALAVLTGRAPADVTVAVRNDLPDVPQVPVAIPSQLLERRPDVAAAERRVAAANAQVGVATAAMFPTISLSATAGTAASTLAGLFAAPALFWSVGPSLAAPLFDAGLRQAQRAEAVAQYEAAVATYRQAVLSAFGEVEDQLASLAVLEEEQGVQDAQVRAARESVQLVLNQYRAGLVSFINVVDAQATAFAAERSALDLRGRRLVAAVALVKALGGGYNGSAVASSRP
jgi:NodT family efflux transporter outer membrane factor (OMF) lipoprotein